MSGQAGYYYFDDRPIDRSRVVSLHEDLACQGPDRGSQWARPGTLMVHRACHFDSVSEIERQPYVTRDGLVVTFDGRLDNRGDLLILLRDHLRGEITDVALAAAAYVCCGEQGLARLIGDWSLAIWDDKSKALLLASDFAGVRPLYYSFDEGQGIRWSSSLQSLVDWTDSAEDLDEAWIAAFLTARPKFDHTPYRRIRAVPPAHAVRASHGQLSITRFWSPQMHDKVRFHSEGRYEEELFHHFRDAVAARLRSNRPVSCELSGGLDSSSITCMAHELVSSGAVEADQILAYTELDHSAEDKHYARIVLEHLGIECVSCDMQSNWSLDPGQPRPEKAVRRRQLQAKLLLKKGVRINLTGNGGDSIMANVVDDYGQIADPLTAWNLGAFFAGAYAWSRALRLPIYQTLLRSLVPFYSPKRQVAAWKQQSLRQGLYHHIERHRSCFTAKVRSRESEELSSSIQLCRWFEASPGMRKTFCQLDFLSLNRGLETPIAVAPIAISHAYMHRPLVDYVSSIPRQQLCGPGRTRHLMRRAFAPVLPAEIVNRKSKAVLDYQVLKQAQELLSHLPEDACEWEVVKRDWVDPSAFGKTLDRLSKQTLHELAEMKAIITLELWLVSRKTRAIASADMIPSKMNV